MKLEHLEGRHLIYFVQMGEAGPIKIGRAWGLADHLTALQQTSPHELFVRGVIVAPDVIQLEKQLHHRFEELLLRGEWFRADAQLLDYIAQNTVSPETVPALDPDEEGVDPDFDATWLDAELHLQTEPRPLMTLRELAADLKISRATLMRYVRAGTVPCLRIGRQIRFYPPAIYQYLQKLTPMVKAIEARYGVDPFVPPETDEHG